jgi:hypothetical protein
MYKANELYKTQATELEQGISDHVSEIYSMGLFSW